MKQPVRWFLCAILVAPVFAQSSAPVNPRLSLRGLQHQAQRIAEARTNQERAQAWLALNHEAVKFAEQMNRAFPNTSIRGDKITPPEAQRLSEQASSYGVRIDFCEPGGDWGANNEGYFKYLELWPDGPDADLATWMGPLGNQSFCGDFEGTVEELQEIIRLNRQFIAKFPGSRFASEAKQRLADAQKMLAREQQTERPH
jgi:hypothetical protein